MISMTGKKITILCFIAIFSALFFNDVAFASSDPANPTFFSSTVDPTGTGTANLEINIIEEEGNGGNAWYFLTSSDGSDVINGSSPYPNWCWPAQSGSTNAIETVALNSSVHQIVSPNGNFASCNNTGTYYIVYRFGSSPDYRYYYTQYNYDSVQNVFSTAVLNQTYNQIVAPQPYGVTTASTSVNLSVTYRVAADFNFAQVPAFNIGYRIYDAVTGELETEYSDNFEENTALFFTYSTTTALIEGSKIMRSYIENAVTGQDLVVEDDTFFNVVTNTYLQATGIDNPRANPGDLSQIDCDTFDIGCQFQKALTFLIIPSQGVLDRYNSLWQQIRYKIPFGYVTVVITQLQELDNTATAVFDFGDLPFMSTVFTPFKDAISLILWGIFAIYFYQHRLTKLDI